MTPDLAKISWLKQTNDVKKGGRKGSLVTAACIEAP